MKRRMDACSRWALLVVLLTWATVTPGGDVHEGVASCAGGTCHGATQPLGDSGIRQDEYFVWQRRDAHTGAYAVLSNERSRRIGTHLGIDPPKAAECLACHADNVPLAARGERFLLSDGIGCETCHGGAGRWLAAHTEPGLSLAQKKKLGMTPTWEPPARAALCLQCHQGDAEHPITHAMMAAGHPPLQFELDTFSALQPPHHDHDADYSARKGARNPARDWAVGQAMAADAYLRELASGRLGGELFPELMLFDCDACHHSMNAGRWLPGRSPGLAAGAVPLADAALHWLGVWLDVTAPEAARAWREHTVALHTATTGGTTAVRSAAQASRTLLNSRVLPLVSAQRLDKSQVRSLLRAIAATADSPRATDFRAAEQAAMAAMVMGDALGMDARQKKAVSTLYATVSDRDRFQPAAYQAALAALAESLR